MVLSSSMDFNSNSIEAVIRELAFFKVVRSDELFCQSTGQGFCGNEEAIFGKAIHLEGDPFFHLLHSQLSVGAARRRSGSMSSISLILSEFTWRSASKFIIARVLFTERDPSK